jgi:hypothetical protein
MSRKCSNRQRGGDSGPNFASDAFAGIIPFAKPFAPVLPPTVDHLSSARAQTPSATRRREASSPMASKSRKLAEADR